MPTGARRKSKCLYVPSKIWLGVYQDEHLEAKVVSIWAGDLEAADDVAEYFGQPFERDFGFLLDQNDLPEIASSPIRGPSASLRNPPLERVEVRELIDGFSWSVDWANEAEHSCRKYGIDAAKVIAAFPHLKHRPDLRRNPQSARKFVGNFPWPGGEGDWEERLKLQVTSPPFPTLRRRMFGESAVSNWRGRIHLEAWKGFAKREQLADEFMSFRFSAPPDGGFALDVTPARIRQGRLKPTRAQARAFQHLLENQREFRDIVLRGIFSVYADGREKYYGGTISSDGGKTYQTGWQLPDLLPPENMSKLSNAVDLVRIISPCAVQVLAKEIEGLTRIGFAFDCKWDPEHGLGVLTHKERVIEVGQADAAFTDA